MKTVKPYLLLHAILLLYSLSAVCSKLAGQFPFLSLPFCVCYGGVLGLLFMYALAWQQIIKRLPLTTAFANKAVTVVWGIVWGALFFHETVTVGKLCGAALIVGGIVMFSVSEKEKEDNNA